MADRVEAAIAPDLYVKQARVYRKKLGEIVGVGAMRNAVLLSTCVSEQAAALPCVV